MPRSKYAYSLTSRQEQFSIAYVQSISSATGYKVVKVDVIDEDSVDIQIEQKGGVAGRPYYPVLRVQAKCTYHYKPKKDNFLHFPLSAKNYDDLKAETGMPFILVVVCIPSKNESEWLVENNNSMALHNVAYWMSLRGMPDLPPSKTKYEDRTKTILIPTIQRLDTKGLVEIMDTLADGRFPK